MNKKLNLFYRHLMSKVGQLSLGTLLLTLSSANAEEKVKPVKPVAESVAEAKAEIIFGASKFTRGFVGGNKRSYSNEYYLAGQTPEKWRYKLAQRVYLGESDAVNYVQKMEAFLIKSGYDYEVFKVKDPKASGLAYYSVLKNVIEYNIYFYQPGINGKSLIVRHFAVRNLKEKKPELLAQVGKNKAAWLAQLMSARFPKFKVASNNSAKAGDKLPVLKFEAEKVDDIQDKGKKLLIDAAFAKKNGAKKLATVNFSVVLPQAKNVVLQGRPAVPEIARINLLTEKNKLMENIRFTSLTIPLNMPIEVRVRRSAALLESQLFPQFAKLHKSAIIVKRYRTKVGPYDGAVLLGQITTNKGKDYLIKFVTVISADSAKGLAVVMLLDPASAPKESLQQRLDNGFAQQVLHSIRFLK